MASEFGKPRQRYTGSGHEVYFERNCSVGHHDGKWFPLEVSKDGLRIEPKHQCPHRYKSIDRFVLKPEQNDDGLLVDPDRASTIAMTTDNLAVIKAVVSILQEFVTIKEGMSAAAAASTVTSQ